MVDDWPQTIPRDKYSKDYLEAVQLFQEDRFEDCLTAARYNLTNPILSRYFTIKNLLLVASAEDDWIEAERCRLHAEELWQTARNLTQDSEAEALQTLEQLRKDLDQLEGFQNEERPEDVGPIPPLVILNSRDDYPPTTDDNIFNTTYRPDSLTGQLDTRAPSLAESTRLAITSELLQSASQTQELQSDANPNRASLVVPVYVPPGKRRASGQYG